MGRPRWTPQEIEEYGLYGQISHAGAERLELDKEARRAAAHARLNKFPVHTLPLLKDFVGIRRKEKKMATTLTICPTTIHILDRIAELTGLNRGGVIDLLVHRVRSAGMDEWIEEQEETERKNKKVEREARRGRLTPLAKDLEADREEGEEDEDEG